jgi:hypothetical protein
VLHKESRSLKSCRKHWTLLFSMLVMSDMLSNPTKTRSCSCCPNSCVIPRGPSIPCDLSLTHSKPEFTLQRVAQERAELKLEMIQLSMGASGPPKYYAPSLPSPQKVRRKWKYEEWRPDGTRIVQWLTDTDIDSSDKENVPPRALYCHAHHRRYHHHHHYPSPCHHSPSPPASSTLPSPATAFICKKVTSSPLTDTARSALNTIFATAPNTTPNTTPDTTLNTTDIDAMNVDMPAVKEM